MYEGVNFANATAYNSATGQYDIAKVSWGTNNSFTASGTALNTNSMMQTYSVSGSVSADGKTLTSMTVISNDPIDHWSYQITNLPLTAKPDGSFTGYATNPDVATDVSNFMYSCPTQSLIDVAWAGDPASGDFKAAVYAGFSP